MFYYKNEVIGFPLLEFDIFDILTSNSVYSIDVKKMTKFILEAFFNTVRRSLQHLKKPKL